MFRYIFIFYLILTAFPNEVPSEAGGQTRSTNNQRPAAGRQGKQSAARTDTPSEMPPHSQDGATRSVQNDSQMLYIVLSVVAGLIALVVLACAVMCIWKRRQRQRDLGMIRYNE